jgi:predicted nucleic acid-binding protein
LFKKIKQKSLIDNRYAKRAKNLEKISNYAQPLRYRNSCRQSKKNNYAPALISSITLMEVLRGIEEKRRFQIREFLEGSYSILSLDYKTIEAYCKIYRKLKEEGNLIPDADFIIAATAIAYDLVLETKDS